MDNPAEKKDVPDQSKQLHSAVGAVRSPRRSGRGLWADLNIDLSAEVIDEVRREMWRNFPRDDV